MTSEEYDKLTDEEKRIKVAELCGWEHWAWEPEKSRHVWGYNGATVFTKTKDEMSVIPDYLNDLNAMYEALSTMTYEQNREYCHILKVNTLGQDGMLFWRNATDLVNATAAQRAKAFVLTMEEHE